MNHRIIKFIVRVKFALTSRNRATKQIDQLHDKYCRMANSMDEESGAQSIRVSPMAGVDEDMRNWSFFMILEHNTIVNRRITGIVHTLLCEEEQADQTTFDPKKDVMPSDHPGIEQLLEFTQTIKSHHRTVKPLRPLRGKRTQNHPLFGQFNAHYWHCMFGFHLMIHYRQAEYVVRKLKDKSASRQNRQQ